MVTVPVFINITVFPKGKAKRWLVSGRPDAVLSHYTDSPDRVSGDAGPVV